MKFKMKGKTKFAFFILIEKKIVHDKANHCYLQVAVTCEKE
jgi:hypothetical protein